MSLCICEGFSVFVDVFVCLWRFLVRLCVFVKVLYVSVEVFVYLGKFLCIWGSFCEFVEIYRVIVEIFCELVNFCGVFVCIYDYSVSVKSIKHVYTLRDTTLEVMKGEISDMDHCVPMPCLAVKPRVLAFMWMSL